MPSEENEPESGLVTQAKFGDITFGAPKDVPLLSAPWGFYRFMGLPTDATLEEIKKRYKEMAVRLHPDKTGGDPKPFQDLEFVVDVLLDDGGVLGQEHSKKRHYDQVCMADTYFDGHITKGDARTKRFSEIILTQMQLDRKVAENVHEVEEREPRLKELRIQVEKAIEKEDEDKLKKIMPQMDDLLAKALGIKKEDFDEIRKERQKRREERVSRIKSFISELERTRGKPLQRVLDIFYLGDGTITFGTDMYYAQASIANYSENGEILELVLGGDNHLVGCKKVHLKAEKGVVRVEDPKLEGIFHVMDGEVNVHYTGSTYGTVIKARSPETVNLGGFTQKGELFIPTRFARDGWWKKEPKVEIAVKTGRVTLRLDSQDFGKGSLESMLDYNSIENNIISNDIYNSRIIRKFF